MNLQVSGIEEVNKVLESIAPRHAASLARSTVHSIASAIAKEAKAAAPKDRGDLKRSIKSKRRRSPSFRPRSDVIVTHGSGAKNDAWYWHFIEFGTKNKAERPFFMPVYNRYQAKKNSIWKKKFFEQLAKKLEREAKRQKK